ncbi:MAG: SpoIID/LytB domain-containing protein [Candidatus Omnitrophica bacterium]|nr:SpoIID/LytB domain-containing protein [Candidatus Omnitrophota bacterium]
MIRIFKIVVVSILITAGFAFADTPRYVRVAIIQDAPSLSLKIKGFFRVKDLKSDKIVYRAKSINTTVTTYKNGIILGGVKPNSENLLIESDDPEAIIINGRMFRGNIQFIRKGENKILVVNHIELQDYIKGIMYHETSHYWPMEALKAQAIVSRTYALYQIQENRLNDFDVTSDIYSQVYGGQTSERFRTTRAVDETDGKVLFYKGKIIPAYFHATCGGHTEDAALLWNLDLAPLKGVACAYCRESPHFNWHYDLTLKEIGKKLSDAGFKIKNISNINIEGRDKSGRITNLLIMSEGGEVKVPAKDFRGILGPNIIRSTNFSVAISGKDAVFEGIGWGHGVGLCQWGAYFMAKDDQSAEQILKYYYPGTNVKTL